MLKTLIYNFTVLIAVGSSSFAMATTPLTSSPKTCQCQPTEYKVNGWSRYGFKLVAMTTAGQSEYDSSVDDAFYPTHVSCKTDCVRAEKSSADYVQLVCAELITKTAA